MSFKPGKLALLTDLYELAMLQAYFVEGMTGEAVSSLFVRRLRSWYISWAGPKYAIQTVH